jgi:hypothetical protein
VKFWCNILETYGLGHGGGGGSLHFPDDSLVTSRAHATNEQDLRQFLGCLQKHGLVINVEKCVWAPARSASWAIKCWPPGSDLFPVRWRPSIPFTVKGL